MADAILAAREVTKTYKMGEADVHALRSATVDVVERQFLIVVGTATAAEFV